MTKEISKQLVKFLKAVANARRLKIIQLLAKNRAITVSGVAEHIRLSFRSTSHHLRLLRAADILDAEQRGPEVYYGLNPDAAHTDMLQKISSKL